MKTLIKKIKYIDWNSEISDNDCHIAYLAIAILAIAVILILSV